MAEKYDPLPDLAKLLAAALRAGRDGAAYADRIAERLGLGEDDSAEVVAGVLREALGLAVTGACELVPLKGGTACAHAAVVRLTGACLHGHVAERLVCQEHRTPGEPLWCRACYRLPEPGAHKCPVALFPAGASTAQAVREERRGHRVGDAGAQLPCQPLRPRTHRLTPLTACPGVPPSKLPPRQGRHLPSGETWLSRWPSRRRARSSPSASSPPPSQVVVRRRGSHSVRWLLRRYRACTSSPVRSPPRRFRSTC